MELTSYQAETVRFSVASRGYDPDEVDRYQVRVARALAEYERMLAASRERIERLERTIAARSAREATSSDVPGPLAGGADPGSAAAADAERAAARAEAARIRERARADADSMIRAARVETEVMQRRLLQVQAAIRDIQERMRDLVTSTHAEVAVLGDRIDLEAAELSGDASPPFPGESDQPPSTETSDASRRAEEPTFYKRRLSGLRERLRDVER